MYLVVLSRLKIQQQALEQIQFLSSVIFGKGEVFVVDLGACLSWKISSGLCFSLLPWKEFNPSGKADSFKGCICPPVQLSGELLLPS